MATQLKALPHPLSKCFSNFLLTDFRVVLRISVRPMSDTYFELCTLESIRNTDHLKE